MNETKPMPGPWRCAGKQVNGAILIRGEEASSMVATVLQNDKRYCTEDTARLISAAPELLEALNQLVSAVIAGQRPGAYINQIERDALKAAQAAISKAERHP